MLILVIESTEKHNSSNHQHLKIVYLKSKIYLFIYKKTIVLQTLHNCHCTNHEIYILLVNIKSTLLKVYVQLSGMAVSMYSAVCPPNHYGPSCARCRKTCQSCDSITGRCTQCPPSFHGEECQYRCPQHCLNMTCDQTTGRCTQCPPSFYGEDCQYSCPQHCLDLICDQATGRCNGCQNGYEGQRCELEITTAVLSTGIKHSIKCVWLLL